MNTFKFKKLVTLLACMALSIAVHAESIHDWPGYDGLNIDPIKNRFIELFENEPDRLNQLGVDFKDCQMKTGKLAKLSGVNEEAVMSQYSNIQTMKVKIKLDIKELTISSSAEGCAALSEVTLEPTANTNQKLFHVPSGFDFNYLIFADFKLDQEIVNTFNDKEYKSNYSTENNVSTFFSHPEKPIDGLYSKEMYSITNMTMATAKSKSYSMSLAPKESPSSGVIDVTLNRTETLGKFSNLLMINEKPIGHDTKYTIIGKNSLQIMLDGKKHGLSISNSYLNLRDPNRDKHMYACHDNGKVISVFRMLPNLTCIEVTDKQIGEPSVYLDVSYMIKTGLALQKTSQNTGKDSLNKNSHPVKDNVTASLNLQENKRKETEFTKRQHDSKCKLKNSNWVYLGNYCKDGYADGEGTSIDRQGLKFIGKFASGERVKGDIHQNGEMIFSGDLKHDKPDGNAICFFEGEYEECRFFRGKRIDTLYKIRKENAKNLAKIEMIQKENNKAASRNHANNSSRDTNEPNVIVDALEKEGAKRAASFIFDQLF